MYDFLEQVRLRPGVWLPGGSLRRLESVLVGYRVALGVHQIDEDFGFWPEDMFKKWLWRHYGRRSPLGWADEIDRETPAGSTPVAEFFRLLDQFRAEQDGRRPPTSERPALRLVRMEIERHDWDAMTCGCRHPATHLPAALMRLVGARTQGAATFAEIDGHVMIQSNLTGPRRPPPPSSWPRWPTRPSPRL